MILNRELLHNRRKVALQHKLRRLEGLAYGRGLEGLLNRVNKCLVKFKRDMLEYRVWE